MSEAFTPIVTDIEQVFDTLREVVAEQPENVYEKPEEYVDAPNHIDCFYVHPGDTCGCLIGHVYNRLGVPLSVLKRHEGRTASQVGRNVLQFPQDSDIKSAEFLYALDAAQSEQDDGKTWDRALQRAEAHMRWPWAA